MGTEHIKLRAAIVGCGAISRHHGAALRRLGVPVVAVCDPMVQRRDALAKELGAVAVDGLEAAVTLGANVVHVTTPPGTHAAVAKEALTLGCHVFVEKPLATDPVQAALLLALARERGLSLGVDHSLLFDPQVARALEAARQGQFGVVTGLEVLRASDYPPHVPSLEVGLARPGDPFRDLGSHALYLAMAFLGPIDDVHADFASRGGEARLAFDEWGAFVRCRDGVAQVRLSWNERPLRSELIVHGTRGGVRVDLLAMAAAPRRFLGLPAPLERAATVLSESTVPVLDLALGAARLLTGGALAYRGVQTAIAEFYASLEAGTAFAVRPADALEVVRWVEHVARRADDAHRAACLVESSTEAAILVTGASGRLGRALVRRLVERGESVRCFVRRPHAALPAGAERFVGRLEDPTRVRQAMRGVRAVVHAGAAMSGDWAEHERGTVEGTKNVVDAALAEGVRLVHVSSLSVLALGTDSGLALTETFPLEGRTEERGHYSRAKYLAEGVVRAAVAEHGLRAVIVRPGLVFGGALPLVTPAVASKVGGAWVVLGDGEQRLPLVYLDDVVDGIVLALDGALSQGEVVHLVDDDAPTQNEVLARALGDRVEPWYVPRPLIVGAAQLGAALFGLAGRRSPVSPHRFRAAMTSHGYSSARARALLGWRPRIGVRTGIERSVGP